MIIISGPSTIGKNPLIERICQEFTYQFVVPWTTRSIRSEEVDGKDYHFISKDEFQAKISDGSMENWDYCLANYYGFSGFTLNGLPRITHSLSRMALRIKQRYPHDVTTVFLMPENKGRIIKVLNDIYEGEMRTLRLQQVDEEISHASMFDYKVIIRNKSYEALEHEAFKKLILTKA